MVTFLGPLSIVCEAQSIFLALPPTLVPWVLVLPSVLAACLVTLVCSSRPRPKSHCSLEKTSLSLYHSHSVAPAVLGQLSSTVYMWGLCLMHLTAPQPLAPTATHSVHSLQLTPWDPTSFPFQRWSLSLSLVSKQWA